MSCLGLIPGSGRAGSRRQESWPTKVLQMRQVFAPQPDLVWFGTSIKRWRTIDGAWPLLPPLCADPGPIPQTVTQEALARNPLRFARLMDVYGEFPFGEQDVDIARLQGAAVSSSALERHPITACLTVKRPKADIGFPRQQAIKRRPSREPSVNRVGSMSDADE